MIAALGDHGVPAQVFEGLTGVWTAGEPPIPTGAAGPAGHAGRSRRRCPEGEARKIGSIGIHVSRGITTHGLAINVNNDLQPFEWIVPCGIEAVRMTSLTSEHGAEQDLEVFADTVVARRGEAFGLTPEPVTGRRGGWEPTPARSPILARSGIATFIGASDGAIVSGWSRQSCAVAIATFGERAPPAAVTTAWRRRM